MIEPASRVGFRLLFVFLGLFGAAFAIAGPLVGLPKPAVGGTCGPGIVRVGDRGLLRPRLDRGGFGAGGDQCHRPRRLAGLRRGVPGVRRRQGPRRSPS